MTPVDRGPYSLQRGLSGSRLDPILVTPVYVKANHVLAMLLALRVNYPLIPLNTQRNKSSRPQSLRSVLLRS